MAEITLDRIQSFASACKSRVTACAVTAVAWQAGCSDSPGPAQAGLTSTELRTTHPQERLRVELARLGLSPDTPDADDDALLVWALNTLGIDEVSLKFLPASVPDLTVDELKDVTVPLDFTPQGMVLAGGHLAEPTLVPLRHLPVYMHDRRVHASALQQIMASVAVPIIAKGYVGVYVAPAVRVYRDEAGLSAFAAHMDLHVLIGRMESCGFHWMDESAPNPFLSIGGTVAKDAAPEDVAESTRLIEAWLDANVPFETGEPLHKSRINAFLRRLEEHLGHPVDVTLARGREPLSVHLEFFPVTPSKAVLNNRIASYLQTHGGDQVMSALGH